MIRRSHEAFFRANGFVVIQHVLSEEQMHDLQNECDALEKLHKDKDMIEMVGRFIKKGGPNLNCIYIYRDVYWTFCMMLR